MNWREIKAEYLVIVLTLAGWVFTSGILYQKLTDIEAREGRIESKMDQLQDKLEKYQQWVAAVAADTARTSVQNENKKKK
jgi:hypothetical protein